MTLLEFIVQKQQEMISLREHGILDDAAIDDIMTQIFDRAKKVVTELARINEVRTLRFKLPESWGPDYNQKD